MPKKPPPVPELPTTLRPASVDAPPRIPEVPGPSTRPTTHAAGAGLDSSSARQPGVADDVTAPLTRGLMISDIPVPIGPTLGDSQLSIRRVVAAHPPSSTILKYGQHRHVIRRLGQPDEQGLIRKKPDIYVDVEGAGPTRIEVDEYGNTRVTAYAMKAAPGPLLEPVPGSLTWRRIPDRVTGRVEPLSDNYLLRENLHAHLSPYDALGHRRLQLDTKLYAKVVGSITVQIARGPSGEYQAKLANEVTPSGPILELIPGTRMWRERNVATDTADMGSPPSRPAPETPEPPHAGPSTAKRPRMTLTKKSPAPYPAGDYALSPADAAQLGPPRADGLRQSARWRYVNVEGEGPVSVLWTDTDQKCQAWAFDERSPSGPELERIPGTPHWRRVPGQAPEQSLAAYKPTDFFAKWLHAPNSDGVRLLRMHAFADVEGHGTVNVQHDLGKLYAYDLDSRSVGPMLEQTPDSNTWRVTDTAALSDSEAAPASDLSRHQVTLPRSRTQRLMPPNAQGLRLLTFVRFVEVEHHGMLWASLDDTGRLRATLPNEFLPSGPFLDPIRDQPFWRVAPGQDVPESLAAYQANDEYVKALSAPDVDGTRTLDNIAFVDIEGAGTVQVQRYAPVELRATDHTGTWEGPLLERVPGKLTWREKRLEDVPT